MQKRIEELFQNKDTIYVFDVDGVLVPMEYGEYNHYALNDTQWAKVTSLEGFSRSARPLKILQEFIKERDIHKIYVATKVFSKEEGKWKVDFLKEHYGILEDHIYIVFQNEEKLDVLYHIKKAYPLLEDKRLIMIEDNIEVLNYVMENSSFSTVHISSFLK